MQTITHDTTTVRDLDLTMNELEPLEAPDFWDGMKAGLAVGATAGAAVVGYAAATGGVIAFT